MEPLSLSISLGQEDFTNNKIKQTHVKSDSISIARVFNLLEFKVSGTSASVKFVAIAAALF